MPRNGYGFRIVEKQILNVRCHADGLLGMVQVQMPEQCDNNGMFYRIRDQERARNLTIIQNTITTFGNLAQRVNAPAIILFPELSVSEEASDWLRNEMVSARISPNTLIVLGLEHVRTDQFTYRASNSNSIDDFAGINFGQNVDRVNTAIILVKDNASNIFCHYQPKCSRSDYESPSQLKSNMIYKFAFGQHNFIVNICSDFFLQSGARPLVGAVMQDIDLLHQQPHIDRIDLILLIQKNPSPLNDLYHKSVECLFYNTPHHIHTSDTIVCAVNSANQNDLGKFRNSNISVMRRGRPPEEFEERHPFDHFAWCSHKTNEVHRNEDLHYARWRLRCAGAISFILDTNPRPWLPADLESIPVRAPGLHMLTDANEFEAICPIPEVYELQEILYHDFQSFIDACFQVNNLRHHFGLIVDYESLLNNIIAFGPYKIIELLLLLHKESVNCDHWNMASLEETFRHFLLTLRLLSERYSDMCIHNDQLHAETQTFGVMDCKQSAFVTILRELRNPKNAIQDIDVLLVQRISELYPWDGTLTRLDDLQGIISTTRADGAEGVSGSISKAPSPHVVDVGSIVTSLNRECSDGNDIRRVLNEIFRFT